MLNAESKMRRGQPGHLTRRDLTLLHVWLAVYLRASFSRVLSAFWRWHTLEELPAQPAQLQAAIFLCAVSTSGPFVEEQACDPEASGSNPWAMRLSDADSQQRHRETRSDTCFVFSVFPVASPESWIVCAYTDDEGTLCLTSIGPGLLVDAVRSVPATLYTMSVLGALLTPIISAMPVDITRLIAFFSSGQVSMVSFRNPGSAGNVSRRTWPVGRRSRKVLFKLASPCRPDCISRPDPVLSLKSTREDLVDSPHRLIFRKTALRSMVTCVCGLARLHVARRRSRLQTPGTRRAYNLLGCVTSALRSGPD